MRVVLEVTAGPHAGKTLELREGQSAQVGRASRADLSIPDDRTMTGWHFALACDQENCRIRDLKSAFGTSVNGSPIKEEVVLSAGDTIVAGGTSFKVLVEGGAARSAVAVPIDAPTVVVQAPEAELEETPPRDLLQFLRGQAQPVFAILDAARNPRVLKLLQKHAPELQSLYEGEQGEELAEVAPYLVHLPAEGPLLEELLHEGWGQSWGVLLSCPRKTLVEVRRHLRHFLMVKVENGERAYFRFYDPRVLRVFLPTCNFREMLEFFGPIEGFFIEGKDPATVLRMTPGRKGADQEIQRVFIAQPAGVD